MPSPRATTPLTLTEMDPQQHQELCLFRETEAGGDCVQSLHGHTVSPGLRQDLAQRRVHQLPPGYMGSLKWAGTFLHPQKLPSGDCDMVNSLKLGCRCQAGAQPWNKLEVAERDPFILAPALPGPCLQPLLRNCWASCE